MTVQSELLTRREAASYLGVSVATLEAWACRRVGPPMTKIGRLSKYSRPALERYIAANTTQPADAA